MVDKIHVEAIRGVTPLYPRIEKAQSDLYGGSCVHLWMAVISALHAATNQGALNHHAARGEIEHIIPNNRHP